MKKSLKLFLLLILIGNILSCSKEQDTDSEFVSFYSADDIVAIEIAMGGTFMPFFSTECVESRLLFSEGLNFDNVDFEKSFMIFDFNHTDGLNFYYFAYDAGGEDYFIQNSESSVHVSGMVEAARLESELGEELMLKSAWGDCYKRVKEQLKKIVNHDGENEAICDGLNYLGLCDAAIAAAATAICLRESKADKKK